MIKFGDQDEGRKMKKTISGLEIEGIIPRGIGDVFLKDRSKRIIEGRYWNVNYAGIAIVASVTYVREEPFDWSAYVGAHTQIPSPYPEEETIEFVWKYGAKLSERDARHFFPNLKDIPYRL